MAIPKVKVTFDADYDQLKKGVTGATAEVEGFGGKVGDFAKKAGAAFAVAGAAAAAYAGKLAIDGVKAAIADEKAQTQLALALKNVTGATDAQVKAVEEQILQMSLASGVADDKLRPAFSRLLRSTEDTEKAQKLLNTALDVSTATGKPLEAVSNALAKAYDGNAASLGKLGIGLDAAELKTMSFEQITGKLSDTFGGAAAANADTYAGRIARMQVAFDEVKETIGTALLPILEKIMTFINDNAFPIITKFSDALSGAKEGGLGKVFSDVGSTIKNTVQPIFEGMKTVFDKVKTAIVDNKDNFQEFFDVIEFLAPKIGAAIGGALKVIAPIAELVIDVIGKVLAAIKPVINFAIDGINKVIAGINLIKTGEDIAYIKKIGEGQGTPGFSGTMPNGQSFSTNSAGVTAGSTSQTPTGTSGGSTTPSGTSGGVSSVSAGAKALADTSNVVTNFNAGSFRMGEAASMAAFEAMQPVVNNITVNGAIDPEGTARTIVDVLNTSAARGTLGGLALVGAFDR